MKHIYLYILSAIPVTIEGVKNFLKSKRNIVSLGSSDSFEKMLKFLRKRIPDILFIGDSGFSPLDFENFLYEILKFPKEIKIIIYTGSKEIAYLKNLIKFGIKGVLNHSASKEKIIEAVSLVAAGGFYIDNTISFSIYSYDITQELHKENEIKQLSKREKELLVLVADGIKNKEIAELLFIAQRTVESHKAHLLKKLNLRSTTELTIFAVSNKEVLKRQLENSVTYAGIEETRK